MYKKYFINNLDTPFGHEFYSQLSNLDQRESFHFGSANLNQQKKFKNFKIIQNFWDLKDIINECDVFVYQIQQSTQAELDFMYDYLQNQKQNQKVQLNQSKVLIVVSSLLSWQATPDKQNKTQQNNQIKDQTELLQLDYQQNQTFFQDIFWDENDYKSRCSSQKEEDLQDWEDLFLSNKNENLKVIIISAGLIYGRKEDLFYKYLKAAYLQQQTKLYYQGDGKNLVPTIHIKDLISMIIYVSETVPDKKYIFAVDNTDDRKLKSIVQGISSGIGSGHIEQIADKLNDKELKQICDLNSYDYYCLQLHLNCKPSKLFVGTKENPSNFKWHCEKGIVANLDKLLQEFLIQLHEK
ncbi:unnamed protein product [Paramecium sonneborni]|uniref:Uncharacterized protein n=1 Tax=Paramecium sonneborni TaxID=65129 RepID=A0A8S1MNW8_9CILI|nr:unnamed protein product [Paramecium sonneborni]